MLTPLMKPSARPPCRWLARFFTLSITFSATATIYTATAESQWLHFRDSDQRYLEVSLARINDLSQRTRGSSLQQRRVHDLALLQQLLDDRTVTAAHPHALQGMGVAIGELLRRECDLHWGLYRDHYGLSRALKSRHKKQTLFPITMISRRVEAGIKVDIATLYRHAQQSIRPPCSSTK